MTIYAGQPHVWYHDFNVGDLRHAWWNGVQWNFETLDGAGGGNGRTTNPVGQYNAAATFAGQLHVWHLDLLGGDLRHAWWNGVQWTFETLDGAGGAGGRTSSLVGGFNAAAVNAGQLHVWYRDYGRGALRHAWWDGVQWRFETLDGDGGGNGRTTNNVGAYNAVTIYAGEPHVWYHDFTAGDLRHAWWDGARWTFETLDGAGGGNGRTIKNVGQFNAVALHAGQPHVWYYDATVGTFRHAWWG